ncbi:MAG: tetratricopeptide repeat protein [Desulfohalobiaceae bacterium]|nr:tetratricopeptide repeat protein [Desulfohalobiaceae bacterium]
MAETAPLRPVDLLLHEAQLLEQAARICPFRSGHVTFPRDLPEGMNQEGEYRAVPLAGEDKLFIPLIHCHGLLGVLFLEETPAEPSPLWLRTLVPYMERCLEALALARQRRSDALTGLLQQEALLEDLEQEIETIAENILPSDRETEPGGPEYRGEVALLAIQVTGMQQLCEAKGYGWAEELLLSLARKLADCCPPSCSVGRLDNHRLGVMLPRTGPTSIRKTAERIQSDLAAFSLQDPVTGEETAIRVDLGLTVYPQDLFGPAASAPPREQARVLLVNSLRALEAASSHKGEGSLFFFSSILTEGGRIRNTLTQDRALVDLGRRDRAREGQIFSVRPPQREGSSPWPSGDGRDKAELMLIDTDKESSLAQILHQRPGAQVVPGDRLIHQPHPEDYSLDQGGALAPEEAGQSCLLSLPRFLTAWRRRCQKKEAFCLALCRIRKEDAPHGREFDAENGYLRRLLDTLEQKMPPQGLAGSYGSACFILYLPGTGPEEARELLHSLPRPDAKGNTYVFRAGIGYYPCLNYTRLDVAETARNALEHAELLSGNAVTVFDSLSLTVSADRHYARGDLAEAITDYQQALLLDPENHLARNSLAICHAHLGRNSRAQQEFQDLLARDPDHIIALYNHACLSLKMEQLEAAEENLQRCLELQPEQHFCLIRLGQIRERKGDIQGARDYYQRANHTPQGPRYAYKHLARLDHLHGDLRTARDNLQKAVQANPWDAEALHLMARIYLEAGEDPELVESLAKRSYSLRPDLEEHLRLLEEILISRGKEEEARHLRLGAEE